MNIQLNPLKRMKLKMTLARRQILLFLTITGKTCLESFFSTGDVIKSVDAEIFAINRATRSKIIDARV